MKAAKTEKEGMVKDQVVVELSCLRKEGERTKHTQTTPVRWSDKHYQCFLQPRGYHQTIPAEFYLMVRHVWQLGGC
jgi:hypothetical protein